MTMKELDPRKQAFLAYLSYFPLVEPPVSITADSILDISRTNKALPYELLYEFVFPWREEKDLAEWIPAFSLPPEENYIAIVIWELDLLNYNCILVSYDEMGHVIQSEIIAQMAIDDSKQLNYQAAVIDEDRLIYTMKTTEESLQESSTISTNKNIILDLTEEGKIVKANH